MPVRPGFKYSENLYGTLTPVHAPGEERHFVFHIDAITDHLWTLLRHGKVRASGHVEAEGLAGHSALEGFMIVKPWLARFIRYEFDFMGDDGALYHYSGQKTIRHLHPVRTWTTLPGAIHDAQGKEIARTLSRFELDELVPFLRSFKPVLIPALARA